MRRCSIKVSDLFLKAEDDYVKELKKYPQKNSPKIQCFYQVYTTFRGDEGIVNESNVNFPLNLTSDQFEEWKRNKNTKTFEDYIKEKVFKDDSRYKDKSDDELEELEKEDLGGSISSLFEDYDTYQSVQKALVKNSYFIYFYDADYIGFARTKELLDKEMLNAINDDDEPEQDLDSIKDYYEQHGNKPIQEFDPEIRLDVCLLRLVNSIHDAYQTWLRRDLKDPKKIEDRTKLFNMFKILQDLFLDYNPKIFQFSKLEKVIQKFKIIIQQADIQSQIKNKMNSLLQHIRNIVQDQKDKA